jgi:hypothetical protein
VGRELTPAEVAQRRQAPVKHRAYAKTEEARRLPDHRVKYARRKVRRMFPDLTERDDVLVQAYVIQLLVTRDMQEELNDYRRRGEGIPARLRVDVQTATAKLLRYDGELRARNDANASGDPTAVFLRGLPGGRS